MADETPAVPVVAATPPTVRKPQEGPSAPPGAVKAVTPTPTPPEAPDPRLEAVKKAERDFQSQRQAAKAEIDKARQELAKVKADNDQRQKAFEQWERATKRAKQDPNALLEAHGLTYDDLAQSALNDGRPSTGMLARTVDDIRAEIAAEFEKRDAVRQEELKQAREDQRQMALQNWHRQTTAKVVEAGNKYPLLNALGFQSQVGIDIEAKYNSTGEDLSIDAAAEALEKRLDELVEKVLTLDKYKERMKPVKAEAPKAADGSPVAAPETIEQRIRTKLKGVATLTPDASGSTTPSPSPGNSEHPDVAWARLKRERGIS